MAPYTPADKLSVLRDGFSEPNWRAPLAWRELLARVPPNMQARGVFFNYIAEELRRMGHDEASRIQFKMYPLTELMQLQLKAAGLLYPSLPIRDGLRRVGRLAYTSLTATTAGKVLFSVAGIDFRIALTVASKAYSLSITNAVCEVTELHRNWACLTLSNFYNFVDCSQIGTFEGAMEAYGASGRVLVRPISAISAELLLEWS